MGHETYSTFEIVFKKLPKMNPKYCPVPPCFEKLLEILLFPLSLPRIGTMFNFVEICRFVISPLTISQSSISISFFVQKLLQNNL